MNECKNEWKGGYRGARRREGGLQSTGGAEPALLSRKRAPPASNWAPVKDQYWIGGL